jgi:Tfp pilus assembly protein PilV
MKSRHNRNNQSASLAVLSRSDCGASLIETIVAMVILMIGVMATLGLLSVAVTQNWNEGDRATRATEYAQDKMEQLMALNFTDGASNTAVYPTASTGGSGLGGSMAGSTTVGDVVSGTPVTQYVDYIDSSGNLQASSTGALYIRQWSITTNASGNLKTVTVVARALISSVNGGGAPSTTLVSMKSQ